MNQHLKDQFCRAVSTTIRSAVSKNPRISPLDLAERVADAVELIYDMNSGEDGLASIPAELQDLHQQSNVGHAGQLGRAGHDQEKEEIDPNEREPWGSQRATPPPAMAPPARQAVSPLRAAQDAPRRIIMPDDPEFKRASPSGAANPVRPAGVIIRPSKTGSRARVVEKPQWEEGDLIAAIIEATPDTITFPTQDRSGRTVELTVNRNVHNQAGMGSVLLTYTHPAVNQTPADPSTIVPQARVSFSVYDKEINIREALDGDRGVMVQLKGAYRAKPETMEPISGPDPGVLRLDMRTQPGESYSAKLQPGIGQVADPYQKDNKILRDVQESTKRDNQGLAPVGHRFNK